MGQALPFADRDVILFDFDGTLADTMLLGWAVYNRMALSLRLKKIEEAELQELREMSSREALHSLGIRLHRLPAVAARLRKELNKEISQLKPIAGMKEAITLLHGAGFVLGVVTSNSEKNITDFLSNHKMIHHFSILKTGASVFGKSVLLNNLIKEHGLDRSRVVFVGDESRDIEAARKSKIQHIAVSWGFQSGKVLSRFNPDVILDEPPDLVRLLLNSRD